MGAHLVQGEQLVLADGLDDVALANAVAAAYLGLVRQGHDAALFVTVAGVAQVATAEQQPIAEVGNVGMFAHQLEVPGAVQGVPIQHRAGQLVVLQHQFLVGATADVLEHDFLKPFAPHEIAGGEQIDAGDLQFGRGHRALIAGDAMFRQVVGAHASLLEQGRDQPVGDAAMADTLAHGIDTRVIGLQGVVDHDATVAMEASGFGKLGVGADANGHHHQVGGDFRAVLESHGLDTLFTDYFLGLLLQQKLQPLGLQILLQQACGRFVQLSVEQPVADMHHGNVHAAQLQTIRRFQTEQATADHHGILVLPGSGDHRGHVGDVAETDHPGQVGARHRQDEGLGTGGQQQAVVIGGGAIVGGHGAALAVDLHDSFAGVEGDAALGIPVTRIQDDLFYRLLAGQHRRQHDAVVVGLRLVAEYRDVVEIGCRAEQLFQGAHPGHAVAHQYQFHLFHDGCLKRLS